MKIGKVTGNALKRSVLKPIAYRRDEVLKGAGIGADCALFALPENCALASCVQEAAVAGKADMVLLANRAVNSLAACAAAPVAATLGILLPENCEEPELKVLMADAHEILKNHGMQIAGGHTSVSPAVIRPVVVMTAYGYVKETDREKLTGIAPGQDIVLSKWIGLAGTAALAARHADCLKTRYPAHLVEEAVSFDRYLSVVPEAAVAVKSDVCYMHDASEGGIFAALWEMAESTGVGLTIDLKKLPIRQETVEVCEFLGVNPYELHSAGCLVMTAADGQKLADVLAENGIPAEVVGKITEGKERRILNEDEVRYMDRPQVDGIYSC